MTLTDTTALRSLAWAILIGVSAFIALFYLSFLSTSAREVDLLRASAHQDSLLLSVFHVMREYEDRSTDETYAERALGALWSSFDSAQAASGVAFPDDIASSLDDFRTYGYVLIHGERAGDHDRSYATYMDLHSRVSLHMRERISDEDENLQTSVNLWAGLSGVIVLVGFWFTMWLASSESKKSIAFNRLSSIVHVSEDPVIVYDAQGGTVLTNSSFDKKFLGGVGSDSGRSDRFRYLDTTAEGERSAELWRMMSEGLAHGAGWSMEIPYSSSGSTSFFSLYAIGEHRSDGGIDEIVVMHNNVSDSKRLHVKAKEAEDQYRSVVENSPDALVLLQDQDVVYANDSALELFGIRRNETITEQRFSDLFGSAGKLAFHVEMNGRHVGEQILQNAEFRASTRRGTLIDVEASASIVRWGDHLALQATFRDITERKILEREQALWSWEQDALSEIDRRLVGIVDLQTILSSIVQQVLNLSRAHWAGILMYDSTGQYVEWRAMGGQTRQENEHKRVELTPTIRAVFSGTKPLIVQELKDQQRASMASLPGLSHEGVISSVWLPLRVGDRQEGVLAVGYRSYHSFESREMRLLASLAEKTAIALANAKLYENLLERERELELLSGARIDAQEEERRRIAREIHDGLGQILTAVKLNVEIIEDSPGLRQEERKRFADVKSLLDSVMKEAREISYNLMPSVLDDFGLTPALQLLSERFGAQSRVHVQFFSKGDMQRLDDRMEVALYRIVQEALTNSVRHGDAELITVQLSRDGKVLRLTIEDNGNGMDESRPRLRRAEGGGLGLASMKERVNSFNGTLEIDSSPNKGTLIVVELPLDKEKEQAIP